MPEVPEGGDTGRHETADVRDEDAVEGVLDDTGRVIRFQDGELLARVRGVRVSIVERVGPVSFRWWRADTLVWSPFAAISILDGIGVQDMLYAVGMLLIDGQHRPSYDPLPGIDQPILVQLEKGTVPLAMPLEDLFRLIRG